MSAFGCYYVETPELDGSLAVCHFSGIWDEI